MDVIGFSEAATANSRIEIINANPDSTSGIVTVPKTIASGETVTIPAGRIAVLPNLQIDGTLDVQGDVFIPSGSTVTQEMVTTDSLRTTDLSKVVSILDIIDSVNTTKNATSFKNKLINSSFQFNQSNYASGGAVGTDKYGHDGWFKCSDTAGTKATGNSYTFSTVENMTTITIPSGQYVGQIVEGLKLRSGTHTISWVGTASCYIDGVLKAKGSQVTVIGGTNVTVVFTNGTLTDVQFEEGSFATKYERLEYDIDLVRCMRYFQWFNWSVGESYAFAGSITLKTSILPVVMRISPSVYEIYESGANVEFVNPSTTSYNAFRALYTISTAARWYRNSVYQLNARL